MTHDIKRGDVVRRYDGGHTAKVLAVHGDRLWAVLDGYDGPETLLAQYWEKVEPFFKVGKTYRNRAGVHFTVEHVSTRPESGGSVAFGWRWLAGYKAKGRPPETGVYVDFDEHYWTEETSA